MTMEQQLPEGWEKTTLGEICEIFDSKRVPLNREQREQRINNKKTDELFPYYGATGEVGKIDDYIFDGEFILLGEDAAPFFEPNKDVAYCVKGKFWVNNHAHILSSSVLENLYICHYLNQFNFSGYVSGTTRLKLSQGSMKKIPIIYPISKKNQQAIVNKIESLFDEIDEGIGRLKTAAQQIQQYRQSLLKNAFNGELTKEWRSKHADTLPSENELLTQIQTIREQHHAQQLADWQTAVSQWEQNGKEGKKPSKPSSLSRVNILSKDSELPENWLLTEAESICDFITKGTTPPKNELFMKSGEVPFLKVYNLTKNGKLDFTIEPTFVSKETHNNFLNRSKVYPNDILMNIVGPPLGKVSLVPDDYPEWNINQAIVIYRSIFVHSKFLANYLLAEKTIKLMSSQAKTTAGQHNLTLEICRNLPIPVCSLAEQTQIVAILESKLTACDQLAAELAKQLKQAELLKQAVLKAAFSGELRE